MRQFDSSRSNEREERERDRRLKKRIKVKEREREERRRNRRILSQSFAVVRHREVIGFFETLTSVIRQMRSFESVSLKLEWIFDAKTSH